MHRYAAITRVVTETIAVFLFLSVLLLQAANIFFRYTRVRAPEMWVEDFSKYALIWIFFLMWHLADRQKDHFSVDVLERKLPSNAARWLDIFRHLVAIAFGTAVVVSAVRLVPTIMGYPTQSFRWLPMGAVYLVIPVGMSLVLVERIRMAVVAIRS